jgi:hypothetical protein
MKQAGQIILFRFPQTDGDRSAPASEGGALARLSEAKRHVGSRARAIRGVLIKSKSWSYAKTFL